MKISRSARITTALFTACSGPVTAALVNLSLGGTTGYDGWTSLTAVNGYGDVSFPGTAAWKTSGGAWTSFDPGTGAVGAIGSNTAGSGDAALYKIANGAAGGPYPAGSSIYFGGASAQIDYDGGTLGFADATPLEGLKTVAFQVEIGQAFGYDFLHHTLPVLTYTTASGSGVLTASYSDLISQVYSGSVPMPSGLEDIYKNTWGLQYDLSGISDPILSYQVSFTGVQHAQLYAAQLDQSTEAYSEILFPQAARWSAGGAGTLWSDAANWTGGTPAAGKEVAFGIAGVATLDSDRSVNALTIDAAGGFTLNGSGRLTIGEGGIVVDSPGAVDHTLATATTLSGFSLITIGDSDSLTISGNLTAAGFYKKGEGDLHLSGNNTFTGSSYNQLIFMGGANTVSGSNVNASGAVQEIYVKDGSLTLQGGDNRFGEGFALNLYSRRFTNGDTVLGEENGRLVLGDAGGKSDQRFRSIKADGVSIFNEATGVGTTGTSSNSSIVGGSSQISTLTVDVKTFDSNNTPVFLGRLGGDGLNENNLSLVKEGAGVQVLGGLSTYVGDTVIRGGMLRIDSASALSAASNIQLAGGVLGLGFGDYAAHLGSGAGEVNFTGDGGFAAVGGDLDENFNPIPRVVTLNGGAGLTWGAGGFVGDGHSLLFSHAGASNGVELVNAIDLGASQRTVRVERGTGQYDARLSGVLSGTGGLLKTGAGNLELTARNTYSGGTVVRDGTLTLGGYEGSIAGNVLLEAGSVLKLSNASSSTQYYEDRLGDSAQVTMKGATLDVDNIASADGSSYSEVIGKVVLAAGANTIATSRNGIVSSTPDATTLGIGSLERQAGATLHFASPGLGLDVRNQIKLGEAPVLDDGILGGWATTGSGTTGATATEFVTQGLYGLTAYTGYLTATANGGDSSWTAASNVKLNAAANAGFITTVSANRAINSLNIVGARTGTAGNGVNLGGNTLRIESGGLLSSGGASTRSNKINGGFLTAGTGANTPGELIVTATGATEIGSSIVDNGSGKVTLIKTGTNTLTLRGVNTYSGATRVNQGTLTLAAGASLANSSSIQVSRGASLNVSAVPDFAIGANQTLMGTGSIVGPVTVQGTVAAGNSVGTLNITGSFALAATSTVAWEIETDANGGAAADLINISGALGIADTAGFEILSTVIDFSTAYWTANHSFLALAASSYAGDYAASRPFQLDTNGAGAGYGGWSLNYAADGVRVEWTAVPEPSAALLALASALGLLGRRRSA